MDTDNLAVYSLVEQLRGFTTVMVDWFGLRGECIITDVGED